MEVPSNASDDHEIHVDLGRRREAIRNIERQELEAERAERLKQEEADKLNDPVERAKKAVDELKKEISEVEEDTDYDDVAEETVEEVSADANISETEEDDLQEISRIAGINEEVEEGEEEIEEEPKKRGIFSIFGRKKTKKITMMKSLMKTILKMKNMKKITTMLMKKQ